VNVQDYFSDAKSQLAFSRIVKSFTVLSEFEKELEGYTRIKSVLVSGDLLEFFIYITQDEDKITVQKYSFHWQDHLGKLIRRWDNAPHHRDIETFPYHVHYPHFVDKSEAVDLNKILRIIGGEII